MSDSVTLTCVQCNKEFERRGALERFRVKRRDGGPFCGRRCYGVWRTGCKMVALTCKQCGSGFRRKKANEDTRIKRNQEGPFCSFSCARTKDRVQSFMEKWEYDSGCWRWIAALNARGYGCFGSGEGTVLSHRQAFEWYHERPIKDGHILHHICENPACVNPIHLTEVTRTEHMKIHPREHDDDGNFARRVT